MIKKLKDGSDSTAEPKVKGHRRYRNKMKKKGYTSVLLWISKDQSNFLDRIAKIMVVSRSEAARHLMFKSGRKLQKAGLVPPDIIVPDIDEKDFEVPKDFGEFDGVTSFKGDEF